MGMKKLGDARPGAPTSSGAETTEMVRTRFNHAVLLAGVLVTPAVAIIETVSARLSGPEEISFNGLPYAVVIAISIWQLRRATPNAVWLTYPVALGLVGLNAFELETGTNVGGISISVTLAVAVVIGMVGTVTARTFWRLQTGIVVLIVMGWAIWAGLMIEMRVPDTILHGVVPGVSILFGATSLRWLVDRLQSNADEAARLAQFHEAIAACADYLSRSGVGSPDDALRALLRATKASSVFVTRNVEDPLAGLSMSMVDEVAAEGVAEGVVGFWDLVPWTTVPYAFDAMSRGDPIYYRIADTSPQEQAFYEPLEGIEAECNIPILIDGEWHGVLGFSYPDDSTFHTSDFALLQTAARIFGAHWKTDKQRSELEHLVQSKDELIAAVSPELRTPLTGILGFAEALIETTSDEHREFVAVIADQSRDMADIIEDLLVTARVEVGGVAVARESVDLRTIVESVVASSKIQASASGHRLSIAETHAHAIGDPIRIR
jgi:hypothetical protein